MMKPEDCEHNVIRRSKERYEFNAYVCGSCGEIFNVKKHVEPDPPRKDEPMFDRRPPWGFRARQA